MHPTPAVPAAKKEYKYIPPPTVSFLYEKVFSPFYKFICPKLFPSFIHPNVLTLGGLICALVSFFLFGYYSQWFSANPAPWVQFTAAFLFVMYVLLDNCDGIQARRLGVSSPIGEWADHGFDAIVAATSAIVMGFLVTDTVEPEDRPRWLMINLLFFQYEFILGHVYCLATGRVLLGFRYLSVEESHLMYVGSLITHSLFPDFYKTVIPIPSSFMHPTLVSVLTSTTIMSPDDSELIVHFPLAVFSCMVLSTSVAMTISTVQGILRCVEPANYFRVCVMWFVFPVATYAFVATVFGPFSIWWFCIWVPQYGIISLALILTHMENEKPIRWIDCLAATVIAAALLPPLAAVGVSVGLYIFRATTTTWRMQEDHGIPSVWNVQACVEAKQAKASHKAHNSDVTAPAHMASEHAVVEQSAGSS